MSSSARGRPHGAAPTTISVVSGCRGRRPRRPTARRVVAPYKVHILRKGALRAPLQKASPWGEAVERSETDEGAAMDQRDGYMPPHPSRPLAVPPSPQGEGSARRVVAPYKTSLEKGGGICGANDGGFLVSRP